MELKKTILRDGYIDLAFKRYLLFKDTEAYQEAYKWEILQPLNEKLQSMAIVEQSVVGLIRHIQKQNPQEGSFVHWSNPSDLLRYAEARPAEVAELFRVLYHSDLPLEKRIEDFHRKGKEFEATLSLGAPLFGYLLAAYDAMAYPLYKEGIFKDIKKTFGIDQKLGTVSKNYGAYIEVARIAFEHLEETYPELTMLDIQDFFYCLSEYDKVKVESAVDYIQVIAKELAAYKADDSLFLKKIESLDEEVLLQQREVYRGQEKIKAILFKVLDRINEGAGRVDRRSGGHQG